MDQEEPNISDCSENSDDGDDAKSNHVDKQDNSGDTESEDETESESESDDSSEDDSSEDDGSEDKNRDLDHKWEELRNEAPDTDDITHRIAVCNMDWDRIRAVDLLVCFNSFKPASGFITSVKIYPSDFGLTRMEDEKLKGPSELVEKTIPIDQEVDDKKGSKYHREKLRQYQISRLKYFYAVVDCDSPETANTLYEQLNGMEYESSSVRFDLRFIPDDVTFDHEPTSVADKVPSEYKPRLFVTSALQQVKVDLTWDETDPKRREFFQKVFSDLDSVQDDIGDYLASASSESEEEIEKLEEEPDKPLKTKDRIAKYKELLKSIEEKEKEENGEKIDIEVTWEPALKERTEEKVKEKVKKDSLNPFEELLQKKKEQKKIKQKELKHKQVKEDSDEESSELSQDEKSNSDKKMAELALISNYKRETEPENNAISKKKKKKAKCDDLDGFVADMNDPRFSAMHTSSLFNVVPSEHVKKNGGNFDLKRPKEKFKSSKNRSFHKKARYH